MRLRKVVFCEEVIGLLTWLGSEVSFLDREIRVAAGPQL
jgi:hypothetical protein